MMRTQTIFFKIRLFGRWINLARFEFDCITRKVNRVTSLGKIPVLMEVKYEPYR